MDGTENTQRKRGPKPKNQSKRLEKKLKTEEIDINPKLEEAVKPIKNPVG